MELGLPVNAHRSMVTFEISFDAADGAAYAAAGFGRERLRGGEAHPFARNRDVCRAMQWCTV